MANTLVTPTWVVREVAYDYNNKIVFVFNCNREYKSEFKQQGANVGATVQVRRPQRFQAMDGQALQLQDLFNETVSITLDHQKHVGFDYSSAQGTTDLDMVRQNYVARAGDVLAQNVDKTVFENVYLKVPNTIGAPGSVPTTNLAYLQGHDKLSDQGVADGNRRAVLDTQQHSYISNANLSLFNPQSTISAAFRTGMVSGPALRASQWFVDSARPSHTTGAVSVASTPLVNGASQTGSSLITDGWGSGGLSAKEGDVITIEGVNSVNPDTYVDNGRLQEFVLTADITDTTGDATLSIFPSIITSGALQTVSASPANNAVITYWDMSAGGTYTATVSPVGMVFVPEAFAYVTADLIPPVGGAKFERYSSSKYNLAMRFAQWWDGRSDQNITRLDVLFGEAAIEPRFAFRVQS